MSIGAPMSSIRRDPAAWVRIADLIAVCIALALPWSTSLVAIFAVAWIIVIVPTLELSTFRRFLKQPPCILPIAFFTLAVAGSLWSDAMWSARIYAISPTVKLLMLPLLIGHFGRSERGLWVFVAFLASCTLLMMLSWVVAFDPRLALKAGAEYGVPVKNYIDQSQEFGLCAVALLYPVVQLLREGRFALSAVLAVLAVSFVVNMAFVVVSRTALVAIPVMLFVFALLYLKWRGRMVMTCSIILLASAAWLVSPRLQSKTESVLSQYDQYEKTNEATSIGLRLEFWRKSIGFFAEAPLVGHGTGSTRGLFEQSAIGQSGAAAEVIGNPHNQTLNVAVQWGIMGVVVLYAMWLVHLLLFREGGLANWVGLLVVVQNIVSSLFNSHLFDFHEGWMYVLGVGVAGGMAKARTKDRSAPPLYHTKV
ncbi:MAG: O-antigen ligase [Bradyrhizobium sp.]|nr:O-antigen ligase [Bradyrhizobium sp.]